MADLLLEIGTEEIPARFMRPALGEMERLAGELLGTNHIPHGQVSAMGTPRRLVLVVRDVAEDQETTNREVLGPAVTVAFDGSGAPTKACLGFARGQGVDPASLEVRETPKGAYVCAVRREGGKPSREILAGLLPQILGGISFPKSMRWGDGATRFARPIRWIVALLGTEVVPFEFAGLASGNISRGHRFLARGSFKVKDPTGYFRQARTAMVVVDHNLRRQMILDGLAREAESAGGKVPEDAELLETVTFLVEYPVVVAGEFDPGFLQLPAEVLTTSMKSHQKYFPVLGPEGGLKPLFLAVSNMKVDDMGLIRKGNERVLSARLSDARFFWTEDTRTPLVEKVEKLKKVVYQERLGTSWEKMERFRATAVRIAGLAALGDPALVDRAALLSKADLVTEMVGEFPELQGVMGRYYATAAGEPPEVALAVEEHYRPRFAGDAVPATPAGICVGLADRLDTIAGSFAVGQKPTGSEDPYGLRRHALGALATILAHGLRLDLRVLVAMAVEQVGTKVECATEEVTDEILDFFRGRLAGLMAQDGFRGDLIEAVLSAGFHDVVDVRRRLGALAEFLGGGEFLPLAVAFKRVANIVPEGFAGEVDEARLEHPSERRLHGEFRQKSAGITALAREKRYLEVLAELSRLRPAVDEFFDQVMVMDQDPEIRRNRLSLMYQMATLFTGFADFKRLAV
jgi:glycyl-tRNA synthetase beta chain